MKTITDISEVNFTDFLKPDPKETKREEAKPIWEQNDVKDLFGYIFYENDRVLKSFIPTYPNYIVFKKGIVKDIDLTRENPLGILMDGSKKIIWTHPSRVISHKSFHGEL